MQDANNLRKFYIKKQEKLRSANSVFIRLKKIIKKLGFVAEKLENVTESNNLKALKEELKNI